MAMLEKLPLLFDEALELFVEAIRGESEAVGSALLGGYLVFVGFEDFDS